MPLHTRDDIRSMINDPIFGGKDLSIVLPKYKFPAEGIRAMDAYQVVSDELLLDGNTRQNMATFCQTWEEPEVHQLMELCIDKNLIDKDEYPQTAELECRCVHMLADLWHSPEAANTIGASAIGSSEACMLGGLAMLRRWRSKRKAIGKPFDTPNLVCGPVQVVWDKFCRYWDVEKRQVPMERGRCCMEAEDMLQLIDANTIGVVPTFGLTYTGKYELVQSLSQALDHLQEQTGLDVDIHVDGASGAFLAPFCAPDLRWDFRVPRVKSISASGHKYGLAPLGCGWIVWRDACELPEELIFSVNYLGGKMPVFQINFSRPAGQIISQYYLFLRLGREGYRKIHQACYETARYLADGILKLGKFELIFDGDAQQGVPAVTWKVKDGENLGYTLFDLADRLRIRGWQVPAYTLPKNLSDVVVQRVIIRHGLSRDFASLLLDDLERAIAHFEKHPISTYMTESETGGFKHT